MAHPMNAVLAATLLALASGCAHVEPHSAAPTPAKTEFALQAFFPLAQGTAWTYKASLLGQQAERVIRLVGQDGPWTVDSEGERYQLDLGGLRTPNRYLLKTPLEVGTQWKAIVSMSSTENYRIENVGVAVKVPAGSFKGCVTVKASNRQNATTQLFKEDIFCPKVGLTRIRTWAQVEGRGVVPAGIFELTAFTPGTVSP